MRLVCQSTVEPVFGSLLQHYGLRQVNTRSRASAHKTMLLAAMAYNLRKASHISVPTAGRSRRRPAQAPGTASNWFFQP
ncbi:transposase [Hymenobacter tibetensis]|uniref:Transposase n=1 Tax=Hymenobacter tibetensis TaxID=497967 RepID=A0ABY4CSW9_9BACT|nr:transposase [Hymenobacter tibetensis]UOG73353.1 transposase [Hymenobacter tibetensis]